MDIAETLMKRISIVDLYNYVVFLEFTDFRRVAYALIQHQGPSGVRGLQFENHCSEKTILSYCFFHTTESSVILNAAKRIVQLNRIITIHTKIVF